jgi:hypothetical protein
MLVRGLSRTLIMGLFSRLGILGVDRVLFVPLERCQLGWPWQDR